VPVAGEAAPEVLGNRRCRRLVEDELEVIPRELSARQMPDDREHVEAGTGLLVAVPARPLLHVALLADTIHSVSDALAAVPLGVAFMLGRRRPTRRYTYGYGRVEDLAGACIVAVIAQSAVVAAWQAIEGLPVPGTCNRAGWVAVAGLLGFVGNEAVAGYRLRVGRRIDSAAPRGRRPARPHRRAHQPRRARRRLGSLAGWPLADPVHSVQTAA
jgi:Cation efflux family